MNYFVLGFMGLLIALAGGIFSWRAWYAWQTIPTEEDHKRNIRFIVEEEIRKSDFLDQNES